MRRSACSSCAVARRKIAAGTLLSALLNQFRDQCGPAGLVTCTDSGTVIAVEIFIKKDQVLQVRITLKKFGAARDRTASILIANENMHETAGNLGCHFPEILFVAATRRRLDFKVLAVVVVKFLQGFHKEIVQRKPDGAAPVRIASKNSAGRFGGF